MLTPTVTIIILVHLAVVIFFFLKEKIYGLHSVYGFACFTIYFMPLLYNYLLLQEYTPSIVVQTSLLVGSLLVFRRKIDYSIVRKLLQNVTMKRLTYSKIKALFFLLFFLILVSGLIGYGHYFRLVAIGLFSLSVFWGVSNMIKYGMIHLKFLFGAVLSLLLIVIFFFLLWSGYGRLLLVQFFTISLFFFSFYTKRMRQIKVLLLISLPILLGLSSILRVQEVSLRESIETGEGGGSIFAPMQYTEWVYQDVLQESIMPINGDSYVASLLFFIPRQFWKEKPVGYGKTLVEWYLPSYYDTGHSLAGTYLSESIGNFGAIWGIMVGVFIIWGLAKILALLVEGAKMNYTGIMRILVHAVLLAGVLDFIWGGTFTFSTRVSVSVATVLIAFLIINRR